MRRRHARGGAVPKRLETDERLFLIMRPTGAGRELGGLRRLIPHAPYSVVSPPYGKRLKLSVCCRTVGIPEQCRTTSARTNRARPLAAVLAGCYGK